MTDCATQTTVFPYTVEPCYSNFDCLCEEGYHIEAGVQANLSALNSIPSQIGGTCLAIEGQLKVDQDWSITETTVLMQPGASILVAPGALSLSASQLQGCAQRWQGITLQPGAKLMMENTTIQDADYAITASDKSEIHLSGNTFSQNYVSLYVPTAGGLQTILIQGQFQGNTFEANGALLPHPQTGETQWPYAGIWINNALLHQPTGQVAGEQNVFDNLQNGILAENSYLSLQHIQLLNMVGNVGNNTIIQSPMGIGIFAQESSVEIQHSSFEGMNRAIHATASDIELTDNQFHQVHNAIVLTEATGHSIVIQKNNIEFSNYGVYGYRCGNASHLSIFNNTLQSIYQGNTGLARAIYLVGQAPVGTGVRAIENNEILLNSRTNGITILLDGSLDINHNTILFEDMSLPGPGIPWGISLGLSQQNTLYGNQIIAPEGSTNARGMFINSAAFNNLCCNITEGTATGIEFLGYCNNTQLRNHTFRDHGIGLKCNANTIIGQQVHHGNRWRGTFDIAALHLGNNAQIAGSIFLVEPIEGDAQIQLWPSSIQTNTGSIDWFVPQTGLSSDCNPSADACGTGEALAQAADPPNVIYDFNTSDIIATFQHSFWEEEVDAGVSGGLDQVFSDRWSATEADRLSMTNFQDETATAIQVMPNPAKQFLRLKWDTTVPADAQWLLLSPLGEVVQRVRLNTGSQALQLDLPNLPAGLYFWSVQYQGNRLDSGKLILSP
jgi:hypothetical protein